MTVVSVHIMHMAFLVACKHVWAMRGVAALSGVALLRVAWLRCVLLPAWRYAYRYVVAAFLRIFSADRLALEVAFCVSHAYVPA